MKEFFIGSDVSKGYCDFVILDSDEQVVFNNFQLDDTDTGHNKLKKVIDDVFKEPGIVLYVALESTGGYENNWFNFFSNLIEVEKYNIKLSRLNPVGVFHYIRSSQKKITTDKISAVSICEYLIRNKNKIRFNQESKDEVLKKHRTYIKALTKQSTQLKNQFEKHLYVIHPQLIKYDLTGKTDWFYALILKYPTARRLARASIKSISQIPYISPEKAKILKDEAKQSIASLEAESSVFLTRSIISHIISLKKIIKTQKESLYKAMELTHSQELAILTGFPGIAEYSACGLLLEIGSIKRFPSAKHPASYFGIHPVFRESGDKKSGNYMSKQGSSEARRLLFNIVFSAINNNVRIKELYDKYVKDGKNKLSAIGILMHKVTRMIYGMLTNETKYDADVDRRNVKKYEEIKITPTIDKSRRLQVFDAHAPISDKEKKKRLQKEEKRADELLQQMESQNDNIIERGIIPSANINLQEMPLKCKK